MNLTSMRSKPIHNAPELCHCFVYLPADCIATHDRCAQRGVRVVGQKTREANQSRVLRRRRAPHTHASVLG